MKILMLTSGTIHSSLSHRALSLGRALVSAGHDVTILAPGRDKYSHFEPDTPTTIDGVNLVYPAQGRTRNYLLSLAPYVLSSAFEVLRRPADVIYLYKPTPITITGLLAKLVKRTPVVLDMDDLGSEVMRIEHQPAAVYQLVAWCERLAARLSNGIIAASTLLEDHFRALYPAKPVLRLPNGVNVGEFTPARASRRPAHLIFFGALGRETILGPVLKALPEIIRLAGTTPVHLDVLGDGPYRAQFEQTVSGLGLDGHVTFHGWSTFDQFSHIAAQGDLGLCIMPNERTTAACSNQKVFQYMALGLCVVGSRVGDLPLYLEGGLAGAVVAAGSTDTLARTIAGLLHDSAKRRQLAARGRELASTTYAWPTLAAQATVLLNTVAGSNMEVQS